MRAYGSFIQNDMVLQLEQVNLFRDEAIVEINESDKAFYSSNCDLWLPIEEYRRQGSGYSGNRSSISCYRRSVVGSKGQAADRIRRGQLT